MSTVKLPLGLTENGIVNTPSVLTVPATGSSVTLLDSALVQNVGSENMYVLVGGTATATVYHLKLSPMSQADFSDVSYTTVTACADSGKTSNAVVFSVQTNDSVSQGATSY